MLNDPKVTRLKRPTQTNDNEKVPDWIVDQMIQSFSLMVKSPTKIHVKLFLNSVKTFELWDT